MARRPRKTTRPKGKAQASGKGFAEAAAVFRDKSLRRVAYARNYGTMLLVEEIVRNLSLGAPGVVTGFLRSSLVASTAFIPLFGDEEPQEGKRYASPDWASLEATIMSAKITEPLFIGLSAVYARRLEYGFVGPDALGRVYNQPGYGFIARAMQRRKAFLEEAAKAARRAIP